MKRTRIEKGITLIALIITIIILLILVVITIGSIKNSNIITYAQNASRDYELKKDEEESIISNYEDLILESTKVMWKDNGDGSYTKGDTTVKVGETTYTNAEVLEKLGIEVSEYKGTYGNKTDETWTVIGVEGDKIKLVSTNRVGSVELGYEDPEAIAKVTVEDESNLTEKERNKLNLKRSIWSYNNAIDTIKAVVETATKGMPGTRSITIEDIEEILNITDEQKRTLDNSYGCTYRYYYEGDEETGKVYSQYLEWNESDTEAEDTAEEGWSSESGGIYNKFTSYDKIIDGTNENKENIVKLKFNSFIYNKAFTGTKFENSLGNGRYWLASPCVNGGEASAGFHMYYVSAYSIYSAWIFRSIGGSNSEENGVRAIVFV